MPGRFGTAGQRAVLMRATKGVYVICFMIGFLNHGRDFIRFGWRPYQVGVLPLEMFWTALIGLDALVVVLLLARQARAGLLLAIGVMSVDVAANSYALFGLHFSGSPAPLVMQATFFGFVLGSVGFLWPAKSA